MKTVVVDASIILRFLLENHPKILETVSTLLRDAKKRNTMLLSTSLLSLEVGNGLRFTLKDQPLADEMFGKFQKLPIEIVPLTQIQIRKSLYLSYAYGTTVYDTSYHVLALARNCAYLTADRQYYNRAKSLGRIEYVG